MIVDEIMSCWRKHPDKPIWQHPTLGMIKEELIQPGDYSVRTRYDWTDARGVYRQRFDTLRTAQLMARRVSRPTREAEFS